MTRGAKLLTQFITAECGRVEDQPPSRLSLMDSVDVCSSRPVTPFTMNAGGHLFEIYFPAPDAAGRMTSETIPGLTHAQTATQRLQQRFRHPPRRANRKVEPANFPVVTHQTFIIATLILKQVCLTGFTLAKGILD